MPINPSVPTPGLASFQTDTIGGLVELFAGDTPAAVTLSGTYTADLAIAGIPAFTPVQLNHETGAIDLVDGTVITAANAITVGELKATADGVAGRMAVYKAGNFNVNALNWPATLETETKRLSGFDLASCQIFVQKPYYA